MSDLVFLIAGLFLPIFPMSMVFNEVFSRVGNRNHRIALLVLWPQIGIFFIFASGAEIPGWIASWGLLTALLYAFRLLAIREMQLWISFLATSSWAILWITLQNSGESSPVYLYALGISLPLVLLLFLSDELIKRFGAAYTGLYGGLALTQPRFSGILVMVVLAVIATPLFPAFFTMIQTIIVSSPVSLVTAILVGVVWLLWSWAGARLIQGLIVGPATEMQTPDLSVAITKKYTIALVLLVVFGLLTLGGLP